LRQVTSKVRDSLGSPGISLNTEKKENKEEKEGVQIGCTADPNHEKEMQGNTREPKRCNVKPSPKRDKKMCYGLKKKENSERKPGVLTQRRELRPVARMESTEKNKPKTRTGSETPIKNQGGGRQEKSFEAVGKTGKRLSKNFAENG